MDRRVNILFSIGNIMSIGINEKVIDTLSELTKAESIDPYIDEVKRLYEEYDMSVEIRPLEIQVLSLREKFNNGQLYKLYYALGNQGYESLIYSMINLYQTDRNAAVYAHNLEEVFSTKPNFETVNTILDMLKQDTMEGEGVETLQRYFYDKREEVSPYAEIPKYIVKVDYNTNELPTISEIYYTPHAPVELIVDSIFTQVGEQRIDTDEERKPSDVLVEKLLQMEPDDYLTYILKFQVDLELLQEVRSNHEVFQVVGPSNPYPDTDFSDLENLDLQYGGGRMFTDNTRLESDDYESLETWFTGFCDECGLKIRYYFHAVRLPEFSGGWSGCFCSWKCVRTYLTKTEVMDDPIKEDLIFKVVGEYENMMNDIGIADRDPDDE